jgi:glycosyltransferase involved in cell wall biosynthesis
VPSHDDAQNGRSSSAGALVLACDFAARHPGNFLPSQYEVARAAREGLGLDTVFVLPERARRRPWVSQIGERGFALEYLPREARRRPAALLDVARRHRARIVHAHYVWFDLDALYAGRRTGGAVIWHLRNGLFGYPLRQRASDLLKVRIAGRGCDLVIAVSDQVARDALRRGFRPDRVATVENALVLDRFADPRRRRHQLRAELGVDEATPVVTSFCWPPERKGADVVLRAVGELRRRGTDAHLVMVGEPEPLREFVHRHVGGEPPWVSILPVMEDVAALLGASDVFVSAALEEGYSFAIGEALACGVPVLSSDIPGTAHFWEAPGLRLHAAGDVSSLTARLAELLAAPDRQELGRRNRRWALDHLAIDRFVDETIACYERALALRPAGR